MKRNLRILGLTLSLILVLVGCSSKKKVDNEPVITPSENAENVIEVNEITERVSKKVIAGTVAATEILDLLEVEVVGVVTSEKTLPSRYDNVPRIGSPMGPDLEKVVSLSPELYISDTGLKENIVKLFEGQNIEMLFLSNNSYEDIIQNIELLGTLFDKEDKAKALVAEFFQKEAEILAKLEGNEAPKVMVIFGTPESFMLATKNSYVGGLVEKLGGINVTEDLNTAGPAPYIPFSLETVAALNPDVILRLSHAAPEATKAAFDKEFAQGFWVNLDAVKNNNVFDLDPNFFGVTANIRAKEALEIMSDLLY